MQLAHRHWVPEPSETLVQEIATRTSRQSAETIAIMVEKLAARSREIHERDCFNLNPATNVMNPKAEALLSSGLGSRPSLGYPGEKYETGLEAIEQIEVIAAALCAEVFDAKYAEIRVPSGAIANLYGFMACCKPGDTIIVPPASIGGHVTHHAAGCAGLYGLNILMAPVDADGYTVDLEDLRSLALAEHPSLITIGSSLNLFEHPVREVKAIADEVGARLMFDAAHQCGLIAGKAWKNPLREGADFMTMSTYKSLGGPAGGMIVSNNAQIAQALDAIAFPGMTANFDAAKSAAMAISMADWKEYGRDYAAAMISVSTVLAQELDTLGLPVFAKAQGFTRSHQFALLAAEFGGGQTASRKLREAGLLTCGIGLPIEPVQGDMNGLRIGTPELVRWGVGPDGARQIASLLARALKSDRAENLAQETRQLRAQYPNLHYML